SVIEGVLLKPLPYPHPDQLVVVDHAAPGVGLERAGAAPFLYYIYREQGRVFEDLGIWQGDTESVTGIGEPEEVQSVVVTDGVLPLLGAKAALGRIFTKEDDAPGAPDTMLLAAGYWHSRFGGDPSAIGRRVLVNGRAREIIGVLPDSFTFLDRKPALFLPARLDRAKVFLGQFNYGLIARVKPGVTLDQVAADGARLIPVSFKTFPPYEGISLKMFEEARIQPVPRPLK